MAELVAVVVSDDTRPRHVDTLELGAERCSAPTGHRPNELPSPMSSTLSAAL
ncbi:hypothetical protein [Streptomyces sp. CA-179760]|uniref:hypothetical protein n=1 Tax=Streptomyces sp. CA-179760 TaxID=3240054 RepID=UPI003D92C345